MTGEEKVGVLENFAGVDQVEIAEREDGHLQVQVEIAEREDGGT